MPRRIRIIVPQGEKVKIVREGGRVKSVSPVREGSIKVGEGRSLPPVRPGTVRVQLC